MRNLEADLKICKAATLGPWNKIMRKENRLFVGTEKKPIADVCNLYGAESEANLLFISNAREGWPEAIKRAMAAERALNDIYPMIAGRVIQLRNAGEVKAATEWNETAKAVYSVIKGGDAHV